MRAAAVIGIMVVVFLVLFIFIGCAPARPYYPGTAVQHVIPCNADNCGKKVTWR